MTDHLDYFSPAPLRVLSFITYLATPPAGPLAASTISKYCTGIVYFCKLFGGDVSAFYHDMVLEMMKGLKLKVKVLGPPRERLPIVVEMLRKILLVPPALNADTVQDASFAAGACLGGISLLRGGEYSWKNEFSSILVRSDLEFVPGGAKLCLRESKTDYTRVGVVIDLFETNQSPDICVVARLKKAMALAPRQEPEAPLLQRSDGTPLRYRFMLDETRRRLHVLGYNTAKFATHSYRIGGATSLVRRGVDVATVMALGRWKSDAVFTYLQSNVVLKHRAINRLSGQGEPLDVLSVFGVPLSDLVKLGSENLEQFLLNLARAASRS